jgi:hypothetical protein
MTYRDTVAAGMSNDVRLPVDGFKGGLFRIYIGPKPKQGDVFVVIGLAQSEAMARSRFEVTINGQSCAAVSDLTDLSTFSGVMRAAGFACPVKTLRDGYNEVQFRQRPGEPEQNVVWVEIQILPER